MKNKNTKQSFAKVVLNQILSDDSICLFIDQYKNAYISPTGDGRHVYDLDSQEAQDWLQNYTMDNFDNNILLRDEPKNVLESLRSFALFRGRGKKRLELRTAVDEYENFWYDLGEFAVKITPNGWKIDMCPPILFTRNYTQEPQVIPKANGEIWELFDFINVKDNQDKLLLIAFLIASLVPDTNKPILALSGPAGSGKSECAKVLKSLMDPTVPTIQQPYFSTSELDKLALTSAVMAFDNLTTMDARTANHFCCLATGYGVRIRKLYTNRYIVFNAIRPLIVNGISQIITQSDLLTRAIPVELSPLKTSTDDSVFHKKFEEARPRILGAMFSLLSKAMTIFPTITRTNWPRMGAFAKWGCAVIAALGEEYTVESFMEAYSKVEKLQHSEAISANPFVEVIVWYMKDKEAWVGTAGELLQELQRQSENSDSPDIKFCHQSSYWPSSPRSARVQIQKALADLKSMGIIAFLPSGSDRIIRLLNISLPINKTLRQALDEPSPNGATYSEQGYQVEDFLKYCSGTVDTKNLERDPNGESILNNRVLHREVVPEINISSNDNVITTWEVPNLMRRVFSDELPKTNKRLEIEAKQHEEEEKQKKAQLVERKKRDKEFQEECRRRRKEQEEREAVRKRKKAEYLADCEKYGRPVDEDYVSYIESGGYEIPF